MKYFIVTTKIKTTSTSNLEVGSGSRSEEYSVLRSFGLFDILKLPYLFQRVYIYRKEEIQFNLYYKYLI